MTSGPGTGVGIITLDGRVLYLNDQAAKIFHGPNAKAADFAGKTWAELHPPEWVEQRLAVLRKVHETGRPALMRTIWLGHQHYTWIHEIPSEPAEPLDEGEGTPDDLPVRFLTITRRVSGDRAARQVSGEPYDFVESDAADLGPLEILSPRELEVLALVGQGLSAKEIARLLHRSLKTIDSHRLAVGRKLHLDDRVKLAEVARRAGLEVRDADRIRV